MKSWLIAALMTGLVVSLVPTVSEAKRLGGGRSTGVQRAAPDKPAPNAPAANPNAANSTAAPAAAAAPTAGAAAGAAAAAPKRSWMGPLAGLAAGLGIAALLGHLGLGAEFGSLLTMLLMGAVAFFVIRFLMRRFAGGGMPAMQTAGAGAGSAGSLTPRALPASMERSSLPVGAASSSSGPQVIAAATAATAATAGSLPEGFDAAAFERTAKMIFIRLQAANDSADLNDLRSFTTPELFASLRLDLQERGASVQQTDVVTVQAQVLEWTEEAERQLVSVRFEGLLREEPGAAAEPFNEIWHLVKPQDDSRAWAIAGIQQSQ